MAGVRWPGGGLRQPPPPATPRRLRGRGSGDHGRRKRLAALHAVPRVTDDVEYDGRDEASGLCLLQAAKDRRGARRGCVLRGLRRQRKGEPPTRLGEVIDAVGRLVTLMRPDVAALRRVAMGGRGEKPRAPGAPVASAGRAGSGDARQGRRLRGCVACRQASRAPPPRRSLSSAAKRRVRRRRATTPPPRCERPTTRWPRMWRSSRVPVCGSLAVGGGGGGTRVASPRGGGGPLRADRRCRGRRRRWSAARGR